MVSIIQKVKHIYLRELKRKINYTYSIGFDALWYLFSWLFHSKKEATTLRNIVFVMDKAQPHIFRLANRINKLPGYKVHVFTSERTIYFEDVVILKYTVKHFRNIWHLKQLLHLFPSVYVVHFFHPLSIYAAKIVKYGKYKTIVDWKDVSINYYGFNPPFKYLRKDLPYEKYAMEYADGIIARSFEPQIAMRRYGIENKPANLVFFEYCENDLFTRIQKKILNPDDIHLVYIGGVADLSKKSPENFSFVIEELNKQKIHFHIYPGQNRNWEVFKSYEQKAEEIPYFHWHQSVKASEIPKEISSYHFGLQPLFTSEFERLKFKRQGSTSMKLFNYLEAGLPIIIAEDPIFQSWLINRYKVGFSINKLGFENLKDKILKQDYKLLLSNVKKARKRLSIERNLHRLIEFYDRISTN